MSKELVPNKHGSQNVCVCTYTYVALLYNCFVRFLGWKPLTLANSKILALFDVHFLFKVLMFSAQCELCAYMQR